MHFNMTRDEFLYDHDVVGVSTMLSKLNKGNKNNQTDDNNVDHGEVSAINFL